MKKKVIKLTESDLIRMVKRIIKEDAEMSMMSADADPISVMRINQKDLTGKKMVFYEYEVDNGYLVLYDDEMEVAIMYDGEFKDADNPEMYIYKPMN